MKKWLFVLLLAGISTQLALAQEKPRFWDDVQVIKAWDKIYYPPEHPVLFIGSSSIRVWHDVERTFAAYTAMNRGIGGAVINDIIFYLNDIVLPYKPKQIVIYVGDNDIPEAPADTILSRTKALLEGIRAKMPEVPILYMSIKPSPSRAKWLDRVKDANTLIKNYIATQQKMRFVDICTPMLDTKGNARPELFRNDMLHMNSKGYDIWKKAIAPYLIKG
ncbi:lysophospholipase L1-like esterase [Chitinophaga dinghuensis]|uniref:Lysophospholipase L1-like esterase n=1 Tax=Chitinophaga dinghuensis TaxID=1539050 RepID=A0A327VU70_9BACT|nr:GDSL-type esterase/lipase family protein [Chitinophaga dinghuensis]RAJ77498.1 lysophospholipase L1-like esterase [Chitinophaga dinghuensis]